MSIEQALLGKTLTSVIQIYDSTNQDWNQIMFTLDSGERYRLYHSQDCCEDVSIEDINGDLDDLVGSPITLAYEATHDNHGTGDWDSTTWTFYHFATAKGYVTIRWVGNSNGYYSESVDFHLVEEQNGR